MGKAAGRQTYRFDAVRPLNSNVIGLEITSKSSLVELESTRKWPLLSDVECGSSILRLSLEFHEMPGNYKRNTQGFVLCASDGAALQDFMT